MPCQCRCRRRCPGSHYRDGVSQSGARARTWRDGAEEWVSSSMYTVWMSGSNTGAAWVVPLSVVMSMSTVSSETVSVGWILFTFLEAKSSHSVPFTVLDSRNKSHIVGNRFLIKKRVLGSQSLLPSLWLLNVCRMASRSAASSACVPCVSSLRTWISPPF